MNFVPITVVIPTFNRTVKLIKTLSILRQCDPAPSEIIVHIDSGDETTHETVNIQFPFVKTMRSAQKAGPGGGRHAAISVANNEIVVSFDDDSYPIDGDFFALVCQEFGEIKDAAVLGMRIYETKENIRPQCNRRASARGFVGCGCGYRRTIYKQIRGYLPLQYAYAGEEADIIYQLLKTRYKVVVSDMLRVYHDIDHVHRDNYAVLKAWIRNMILMVYLHYPCVLWPIGVFRVLRVAYIIRHRLPHSEIIKSFFEARHEIVKYRRLRSGIPVRVMFRHLFNRTDVLN